MGSEQHSTNPEQAQQSPAAKPVRAFFAGFRALWDRIGLMLAASTTWILLAALPLSLERVLPRSLPPLVHLGILMFIPLLAAAPTAGIYSLAHRMATHDEAFYSHFWKDGLRLFAPALQLSLLQAVAGGLLVTAFWFYAHVTHWSGRIALVLCVYALVVWAATLVYHWPALIAQENGLFDEPGRPAKRGAFAAVRRSFFIALGRPVTSLLLLLAIALVTGLMGASIVLLPTLWIGATALLSTFVTRAVLMQYGILATPVMEIPVSDAEFRLPKPQQAIFPDKRQP